MDDRFWRPKSIPHWKGYSLISHNPNPTEYMHKASRRDGLISAQVTTSSPCLQAMAWCADECWNQPSSPYPTMQYAFSCSNIYLKRQNQTEHWSVVKANNMSARKANSGNPIWLMVYKLRYWAFFKQMYWERIQIIFVQMVCSGKVDQVTYWQ